jgi:hypothetical protein
MSRRRERDLSKVLLLLLPLLYRRHGEATTT